MKLSICESCKHGDEKNGKSHCGKEYLYSHLTSCIQEQALAAFLERNAAEVGSQPELVEA